MIYDLHKIQKEIIENPALQENARCTVLSEIQYKNLKYPLYGFSIGSQNPEHPVLFLTGGVHGLERIGAQLSWSLLKTVVDRLSWDELTKKMFQSIRLVVVPLVNPVGYNHFFRSNGNGVDLMRNAPIVATEKTPFLLGGQSFSSILPWYRGNPSKMEIEIESLAAYFQREAAKSQYVISLDMHSGFGMKDRLWFPFSYTRKPFDDLAQMHALTNLFEQTHPYHIYQIEPQAKGYLLNGDIWDHLFIEFKKNNLGTFLPLTLEMGSWMWVKKNPIQIFSLIGAFNPIKLHRIRRTYRRHHLFFDFLLRSLYSYKNWGDLNTEQQQQHLEQAKRRWYE